MAPRPTWIGERVMRKTKISDGCWEWQGYRTRFGHGLLRHNLCHRVTFSQFVGDIPDGMCVCHKCDNPACVRPSHLFLGTFSDNTQDMIRKGRHRPVAPKGERHRSAKLTEAQVREILHRKYTTWPDMVNASREFGVHPQTIHNISNKKTWKHVSIISRGV